MIGSTKVDLCKIMLKDCFRGKLRDGQQWLTRALVLLVALLALGSISTSLSAKFSFVSPGCTIQLVFCFVLSSWFLPANITSTSLRAGFYVYLSQPWVLCTYTKAIRYNLLGV